MGQITLSQNICNFFKHHSPKRLILIADSAHNSILSEQQSCLWNILQVPLMGNRGSQSQGHNPLLKEFRV